MSLTGDCSDLILLCERADVQRDQGQKEEKLEMTEGTGVSECAAQVRG